MIKVSLVRFLMAFIPLVFVDAYSQNDSLGWSYFPFKTGDMWEYWVDDGVGGDTIQIFNVKDSVLRDGKILLTQQRRFINPVMYEYFPTYAIDTADAEVFQLFVSDPPRSTNVPVHKFNIQQGDQWVLYAYQEGGYEMARVKDVYEDMVFDKITTFIQMHYYGAADSTDTLGLSREVTTLAKGFGVVDRFFSEGGTSYSIKGAVINGILYGDTTKIVTAAPHDPRGVLLGEFMLHQNYPNPFNPDTNIEFQIPSSEFVTIRVFDLLGRQVATVLNNRKFAGSHKLLWDASGLPGGVYYYRMVAGSYTQTRRMILVK